MPKWSPLYTGKQKPPGTPVAASPQQKTAQKVLGVPDNLKAKSAEPEARGAVGATEDELRVWDSALVTYALLGIGCRRAARATNMGHIPNHTTTSPSWRRTCGSWRYNRRRLKMQLDPSFKSLKEAEEKAKREENAEAMEAMPLRRVT